MKNLLRENKVLIYMIYIFIVFELGARIILKFYHPYPNCNSVWRLMWKKGYSKRTYYVYDSTKGWRPKPNLRENNAFCGKILNTNSKGLRGEIEYSYDKPEEKIRILVIGDSFTYGDEVDDNSTYSFQLGQMLPKAEIINFGVGGYGNDQMLIYLKEEGIKYHPDIVIVGFISDDMERNLLEFRDYVKPRFYLMKNKLILKNSPALTPDQMFKKEKYRLRFFDLADMLYHKLLRYSGIEKVRAERVTIAIFDEMVNSIESINAIPIFVHLVWGDEITSLKKEMLYSEEFLSRYCRERGIRCLLTRTYFLNYLKKDGKLKNYGHWNEQEHFLATQAIKDYLITNNLLESKNN